MDKLGTVWVAKGEGATVEALRDAIRAAYHHVEDMVAHVRRTYNALGEHSQQTMSNLALTGHPLCLYDYERMRYCLAY